MLTSNKRTFKFGDCVFHAAKPEWGPGTVTRAESIQHEGSSAQRLHIRFAHAGLKTINTALAEMVPAEERPSLGAAEAGGSMQGWIASLESRRPEDFMTELPKSASDPFNTLWQRLQFTLDLYRFKRDARSITDWAVAQSGMADPLSRFNRHELEIFFDRWARNRDHHLISLVMDAARTDARKTDDMIVRSRSEARQVLQRHSVRR